MKYLTMIPKTARRAAAVIAATSAAGLIATSAAVAVGSSGAARYEAAGSRTNTGISRVVRC